MRGTAAKGGAFGLGIGTEVAALVILLVVFKGLGWA
jgi:hypothetical protein